MPVCRADESTWEFQLHHATSMSNRVCYSSSHYRNGMHKTYNFTSAFSRVIGTFYTLWQRHSHRDDNLKCFKIWEVFAIDILNSVWLHTGYYINNFTFFSCELEKAFRFLFNSIKVLLRLLITRREVRFFFLLLSNHFQHIPHSYFLL